MAKYVLFLTKTR